MHKTLRKSTQLKYNYSKILTKDFLIKEYITIKKSARQIAKEIGCNAVTIYNYLRKHNIKIRTSGESLKIILQNPINHPMYGKKGKLAPNYKDGRCSKIYYCKQKGCDNIISYKTYFYKSGICARCSHINKKLSQSQKDKISQSNKGKHNKYLNILTKEFLIEEYVVKKNSLKQIAKQITSNIATIINYLKKYNIKIRTMNEARQLAKLIGKNASAYKDGRCSKTYYCIECLKQGIKTKINLNTALRGTCNCKLCHHKICRGMKHPNYIKDLIREYPIAWTNILKESIRERDNHQCQICGKTTEENGRALDVHHIDYNKENCTPANLISLCHKCHSKTNGKKNRPIYIEFFKILKGITNE